MVAIHHPLGRARLPHPVSAPSWWVIAGVGFAAFGAMLPVVQNSSATSEGFGTQHYQSQQAHLEGEISLLEAGVAQLTSLARVQRRASELGLVPGQNPIYVTIGEPGPEPAKLPAEYLPPPAPHSQAPAPLWEPLLDWLP